MRTLLIGLVLIGLVAPASASAWTPPGDRPNRNPLVTLSVAIAESFWQDRNVPVCPVAQLQVRIADDLSDGLSWERAYGRGEMNGCTIWLLSSLVHRAWHERPGNDWAVYLCRTVTTEIGHTGGLDDVYGAGGVMDPASTYVGGTPFACRAWGAEQRRASAARRARGASSRLAPAGRP